MSNLMTKGNYRAVYRAYDVGMTRNGNEQIVLLFEFSDEPYKGREEKWFGTFTDASYPITHRTLVAMGWKGTDLATFSTDVRPGKTFNLWVDQETFEGTQRNRVVSVRPPGILSLRDALKPEQRSALVHRVNKMIADGVHLAGGAQGGTSDDMPF